MKPSVGRIVLYTNLGDRDGRYPPEAQAAIITKVVDAYADFPPGSTPVAYVKEGEPPELGLDDERRYRVSIRVFYEDGVFIMRGVPFTSEVPATEGARGKWGWPPRA